MSWFGAMCCVGMFRGWRTAVQGSDRGEFVCAVHSCSADHECACILTVCSIYCMMASIILICYIFLGDSRPWETIPSNCIIIPPPFPTGANCKQLLKIALIGIIDIDDDSLERLWIACPTLEAVRIDRFSEEDLRLLLRHLPALRELDLGESGVTGECFSLLPGSLQRLSVAHCRSFQSDSLWQLGERCPQLRELDVSRLALHASDLSLALEGCPLLERLTAIGLHEADFERCLPPAGLPALTHLDLCSCRAAVSDITLEELPDLLPSLQTLNIKGKLDEEWLFQMKISCSFRVGFRG